MTKNKYYIKKKDIGISCRFGQATLCGSRECNTCYPRSFEYKMIQKNYIEKLKMWSNKNELDPHQSRSGHDAICIFKCNICLHVFEVSAIKVLCNLSWCPYCSILPKILCTDTDCEMCYKRSFLSYRDKKHSALMVKSWSKKNKILPRYVFKNSHDKYYFKCSTCDHEFKSIIKNVSQDNTKCPYCASKKLCFKKGCRVCFKKSFAGFYDKEKLACWSKRNDLKPYQVFLYSNFKYIFECKICTSDFTAVLYNITYDNSWCPCVKNKTETKLYEYIINHYSNIIKQFTIKNCKKKRLLHFDFCIKEVKIIIELDGPQHFKQISNWKSAEDTLINDTFKTKKANEAGFHIIRILQEDIYYDKFDWQAKILELIDQCQLEQKNIFYCLNNEYDNHINALI